MVSPDDQKVKINWFYTKKIVIGTIRGDWFLCIFHLNLVTSLIPVVTVFSLHSSIPSQWGFFLYYIPLFSSSPSSTCRSSCWLWLWLQLLSRQHLSEVFGSSCKAVCHYSSITTTLMRPKGQLQSIQCGGNSFALDIS